MTTKLSRAEHSVILMSTTDQDSLSNSGTGFVVGRNGPNATILTCEHVVANFADPSKILAAGLPARRLNSSFGNVDLALLTAPLAEGVTLEFEPRFKLGQPACLIGFRPFEGNQFVRECVDVVVDRSIAFQDGDSTLVAPGLSYYVSKKDQQLFQGFSGGPLIDKKSRKVLGVATHRVNSGNRGWAISGSIASQFCRKSETGDAGAFVESEYPQLPPMPIVIHQDDPQKDRWGGKRSDQNRVLEAVLSHATQNDFWFHLIVRATGGSKLRGPVRFHLHDSYRLSIVWVRKIRDNSAILFDVHSRGVYTAAAQVLNDKGQWISLEYDLKDMPGLPRVFMDR